MNPIIQKINHQILNYKRTDLVQKRWQEGGLSDESRAILWRFMPSVQGYFSELNPSFVWDYLSIETMSTYPIILLRDGYYGLSYFFLKHPFPLENFNTTLCIPAKFKFVIPKRWERNVLLYEFDYSQASKKYENGIFFGVPTREALFDGKVLKDIKNAFKKTTKVDFNIYCRDRFFNEFRNEQNYFFDIQKAVLGAYSENVKSHYEFREMDWSKVNDDYAYFNIDQNNFIVYSDYLTFLYASKGATFVNKPKRLIKEKDVIKTVNLSPYHSIKLSEANGLTNESLERLISIRINKIPLYYHHIHLYYFLSDQFKSSFEKD